MRTRLPTRKQKHQLQPQAFTLVECVLAIGVFSFAVVGIIGLMMVASESDKGAATHTLLSQMADSVSARLRQQGIYTLRTTTAYTDANADFFYDAYGKLAVDSAGTPLTVPPAGSIYSCTVTRRASPSSPSLDYIVMEFRWPLSAPVTSQSSRKFQMTVAKYD